MRKNKTKTYDFILDNNNTVEVLNHKTSELIGYIEPVNKSFYQFITYGKIIFNTKTMREILFYLDKLNKEGIKI